MCKGKMRNTCFRKKLKLAGGVILIALVLGALFLAVTNIIVCRAARGRIADTPLAAKTMAGEDCAAIVVLGCAVRSDGSPSPMLRERLEMAASLYQEGASDLVYVSGDHRSDDYNEVAVMQRCLMEMGVPEEAILLDHQGLNTRMTIEHTKEIFGEAPVIFVSQRYHLYRTVFLARREGIEAYAAASDTRRYLGQFYRDLREVAARTKDLLLR